MISESVIFTIGTDQISKCIADYYKVPPSHVRIRTAENGEFVADIAKEAAKWLCRDFRGQEFTMVGPRWITPGMRLSTAAVPSFVIVSELVEEDNHEDSVHTD